MSWGLFYCILAGIVCAVFARRSLASGIVALIVVGNFYGIVRANFLDGYSHFIFDCGLLGFYAAMLMTPVTPEQDAAGHSVKKWMRFLVGWPVLLFFLPINHYLVQLVGLRHIIFFMPAMVYGTRLKRQDLDTIAAALAWLCVIEFGFALLEYVNGIALFFPRNAVTDIMYHSHDVRTAEGTFHRIPATFISSHAYGGNMLLSLPFLINGAMDERHAVARRAFMACASVLAVLGIFIAGPRTPVVSLAAWVLLMAVLPGLKAGARWRLGVCVLIIGVVAAYYVRSDERLQRFTSVLDVDRVEQRATGSLGFGLLESMSRYPVGVGLGGVVGSSMPYFLNDLRPDPVGAENEFIRIAVEQGVVGFIIWTAFLISIVLHRPAPISKRWLIGTHAMHALLIITWLASFIGTGTLQSIPSSFLMLVQMGVVLRNPRAQLAQDPTEPSRLSVPLLKRFENKTASNI